MKYTHPESDYSEDVRKDDVEMYESQGWVKAVEKKAEPAPKK